MKPSARPHRSSPQGRTRTGRPKREKTVNLRRLRRERIHLPKELVDWVEESKPNTRTECKNTIRPCPFVSCKFHLYLDVNPQTGSIKFNFPGKEVWELEETCALDIAERGGVTLEEVGAFLNLTRERIRQVENLGMRKMAEGVEEIRQDICPCLESNRPTPHPAKH